jgi:general L-amino acid transport system permease protein
MTSETQGSSFRLSMLLYDTRYRSLTIQVLFMMLFMAGAAWLIDNTISNLNQLGKPISFDFLGVRAGYDINQRLIDYTNDSSHLTAWAVGLLNTIVLAIAACISATVIGVIAGVLRLSKNWIVSKLMTIYVEIFRNVPLLLWIIVIFAVLTESTPAPNAFRGDNPSATMYIFDSLAITNRGIYTAGPVFSHDLGSITLGAASFSFNWILIFAVLIAGFWANSRLRKSATVVQEATGVRPVTWWKSLLILVLPLLVVLVALGFHLDYPQLQGFNFQGGVFLRNSFTAMWIALTLYTGAFIAENVRAGILAISKGQTEAASALGLRPGRTMNLVVLP